MTLPVTIDFETEGIDDRPTYPPKPVGVAIKWPGKPAEYHAWGHPTENNSTFEKGRAAVAACFRHKGGVLFHNAMFDTEVIETHFGIQVGPWSTVHDTMFLLFLTDPHSPDLHLKSSAERVLGLPPSEQEAVRDWLVKHQPVPGVRISTSPKSEHAWGRYICLAPGKLVGSYATGDVDRTAALFEKLHPTLDEGMLKAYDRERRLLPHLQRMEQQGVRVDLERLGRDIDLYHASLSRLDSWVYSKLGGAINLDAPQQLVDALIRVRKIDVSKIPRTATGKLSATKEVLERAVTDPVLMAALKYRTQLTTCLSTFMEPWHATATRSGGFIYTRWHQCRSADGGTRTGRLSSHPNFQNIPKTFDPVFKGRTKATAGLPEAPIPRLPALPLVRSYVVPWQAGDILLDRDYSQQELRILAHYDEGEILERYRVNPRLDFHDEARIMVAAHLGREIERKPVKNMGFGLLYGMGVGKMAGTLKMSTEGATELKRAYLTAFPGLRDLYRDMRARAKADEPIRTWGGRLYYCEPPQVVDGRLRTFDYKLLNVLIQGSAADCTKEAMIRYSDARPADHRLLFTVHDEFLVSAPERDRREAMEILRTAMESVEFDVPMLSDGKVSTTNWAELKKED